MADRRKRNPAVRFVKRNGLYIIAALVVLLLAGAVFAVISQVRRLSPAKESEQTVQETVSQDQTQTSSAENPPQAEPEAPVDESVYLPPFDGKTVLLADGKLVMTYDEAALTLQEQDGLLSLTDKTGAQRARLDVQTLNADLSLFKKEELERISIGVVQAYYYLAPETKDFTVTDSKQENGCFTASVHAPAYDTEDPVDARVILWRLDGKNYCISAIVPAADDGAAVWQAFSSIELLGEKHLAEADAS